MTYEEAWAAHLKRQNIIPPDEQTFRHGYNAGLMAVAEVCDMPDALQNSTFDGAAAAIRALEVEVQT
jgi:hypothetical protein